MITIAGLLRKSPSKSVEISKDIQKQAILERIRRDFKGESFHIKWFFDVASGDDPNRKWLNIFFKRHTEFNYAYAFNVDRFSRSWLGLMWFHTYFLGEGKPRLRFVNEVPDLYLANGDINSDSWLIFFIFCGMAQAELFRIRARIKAGRERIRADPKLWAEKYRGRPKKVI